MCPFWAARCSGVFPVLLLASTFAPPLSRGATIEECPFCAAKWSGVLPALFSASAGAPFSRSASTTPAWPEKAA